MWFNVICNLVVAVVVISNMICDMWYVYVSDKWYVICVMIDVFCILNSELCHETSWTLTMQMLICATIAGCHLSSSFDHFRGLQSTVLRHVESIHNSQGMILVVGCNLLPDQKTCTHSPIDPNSNGWQGMHVTGSNHQPQLTLSLCHCHCQCLCVWQSDTSIWDYLYVYQSCWITVWYWYWYWLLIRLNSGVCGQLHATTKQNFTVHFFPCMSDCWQNVLESLSGPSPASWKMSGSVQTDSNVCGRIAAARWHLIKCWWLWLVQNSLNFKDKEIKSNQNPPCFPKLFSGFCRATLVSLSWQWKVKCAV